MGCAFTDKRKAGSIPALKETRVKKLLIILVAALFLISVWDVAGVFAGLNSVTIKGASAVQAGGTYEYSITVNATGIDFITVVTSSGAFESASVDCDASGSSNGNLTKTVKLSVTVKADALPGDTGYIQVSGEGCSVDENYNTTDFSISKRKEVTVTLVPEVTPTPTTPAKKPKATPTPTLSPTPTSTPTPTPTPIPTEWEQALPKIESMAQGGTLTLSISDPTVTSEALNALKEKQGTLILDFGSYSCTIDGSSLGDIPGEPINIDMTMTSKKDLSERAQEKDKYQLHFGHSGALPGVFEFKFKATGSQPGDTLYLYCYYDSAKVIEGVQTSVVDDDGYVTFGIYHFSGYFVTEEIIKEATGLIVVSTPTPVPATPSPAPIAAKPEDTSGIGVGALIATVLGTVLLSVLATMLIFRVGVFTSKTISSAETKATKEDTADPPEA